MTAPDRLVIRTPEGVAFAYALATPVSRSLAWLIDVCVIGALTSLVSTSLYAFTPLLGEVIAAVSILAWFAILFGYHLAFEWYWRGQTLGKRLLRLRVIDQQGLRLQFNQVLVRNLLRLIDVQPLALYGIGGAFALMNRHGQRLGDLAAATVVIRQEPLGVPDFSRLLPDKFNSLRAWPHLAARLRQRLDPSVPRLLVTALRRRDELAAAERVALYAELAAYLRAQVRFPSEAVEDLSDEQYLRNCLDLICRPTV